jgi:hypothetical protein
MCQQYLGPYYVALTHALRMSQHVAIKHFCLVLLLVGIASGQHCRKIDTDKSSGFCIVPDHLLTPGKMQASLAFVSNNDRPRTVTDSEKKAILATYGYSTSTKESTGEFDHWLPHWMGGADTQENI